jgi:acyl dehydratase
VIATVGQQLPAWELPITTTLVVSTALATRDFQDVHHDRDLAVGHGSKDIFLNILTTTGLVQRFVGEWAGPTALTRSCELRLGAPAYPGDMLSFQGTVSEMIEVDGETRHVVDVVGTVSLGAHVTARVTVVLPGVDPAAAAGEAVA